MKQTKIISKMLSYICLLLGIGYLMTFLYGAFCLLTRINTMPYSDNQFLHINYPFTEKPFLNVDNNLPYLIFSFLLPLLSYGLFFWLSARVFKVFYQPKLFTQENLSVLKLFYQFNIFLPLPIVLVSSFFVEVESIIWLLVFVHFILGIFSLFLANICEQGLQLQNEQDLFI